MQKYRRSLIAACLLLPPCAAAPALADSPAAPAPVPAGPSPVQLNLLYTGELWDNAEGGVRKGSTYMYNLDAQLRVDTDRAFGWTGGRFWLEGFYENKNSLGNHYVGAVDQQSPIDSAGYQMARLYQAYYDQKLGGTDVRVGIYDLESEFSVTKPMSLFLSKDLTWNTAFDQSGTMPQNGVIGPGNYPYTPLAARVRQTIDSAWSVQAAVADGAADSPAHQWANDVVFSAKYGALGIGEVDYTPNAHTKIMAGLWALSSKLPGNIPANRSGPLREVYGEFGGYLGGAARLYTQEGRRGLDGFLTLGLSSPASTNTSESLNGGLVYTGLLDDRPHDKLGIAFNENVAPNSYRKLQLALGNGFVNDETSIELTYRAPINSWLTVQPDLQYIIHPGYDPAYKNDLVIGVHFEIGHLFDL